MTLTKEKQAILLKREGLGHTLDGIDARRVLIQTNLDYIEGKYDHWTETQFQVLISSLQSHVDACHEQAKKKSERAKTLLAVPVKTTSVVRVVESEPVEEKPATPGHHYASKSKGYKDGLKASFGADKTKAVSDAPRVYRATPSSLFKAKIREVQEKVVRESPMLVSTTGESWERVYTLAIGKRVYRVSTRVMAKSDRYLRIDLVSGRKAKGDTFLDGLRVCSAGQDSRKSCWQGSHHDFKELQKTFPSVRLGK